MDRHSFTVPPLADEPFMWPEDTLSLWLTWLSQCFRLAQLLGWWGVGHLPSPISSKLGSDQCQAPWQPVMYIQEFTQVRASKPFTPDWAWVVQI